MAIGVNTNISSADLTAQTTGTKTVTKPTGTASTDVLVVLWGDFTSGAGDTLTGPTGWTAVTGSPLATSNTRGWLFWALGNVVNLGFTFTIASGNRDLGWVMLGFTGVDNTTAVDATGTTSTNSGSASITANAVTVATANAWEVIASWDVNDGAASATSFTTKDNGSTLHMRPALLYNTTPKSTGSTGTVTVNNAASATGQELAAIPFALRPAAGGAGGNSLAFPVGNEVATEMWRWDRRFRWEGRPEPDPLAGYSRAIRRLQARRDRHRDRVIAELKRGR